MDVAEQGRFCQSCQKTVTDFTGLSNDEILTSLFASGNTCGKISALQLSMLNATLQPAALPEITWWRKLSIAAMLVSVLSLFRAEAKTTIAKPSLYWESTFKKDKTTDSLIDDPITIKGKVVDENNETLPGATVRIKGAKQGTITAPDGTFSIKVPSDKKIELEVLFIGYETKEVKIKPKNAKRKLELKLKMVAAVLGGIAVVYSPKIQTV